MMAGTMSPHPSPAGRGCERSERVRGSGAGRSAGDPTLAAAPHRPGQAGPPSPLGRGLSGVNVHG